MGRYIHNDVQMGYYGCCLGRSCLLCIPIRLSRRGFENQATTAWFIWWGISAYIARKVRQPQRHDLLLGRHRRRPGHGPAGPRRHGQAPDAVGAPQPGRRAQGGGQLARCGMLLRSTQVFITAMDDFAAMNRRMIRSLWPSPSLWGLFLLLRLLFSFLSLSFLFSPFFFISFCIPV